MIAAVFGLVLLVGTSPIRVDNDEATAAGVWLTAAAVLAHVGICVICLLKGKLVVGLAGLPLPTVSFLGAVRVAKPESFWARRFYGEQKLTRASRRHSRYETRRLALRDRLFGG